MSTNSSKASSMAELMAKHKSVFVTFKKGETVTGTISKLTSGETLLELGAKTEAIVLEKERKLLRAMLSMLHVGDKVEATVLSVESDNGNPVVSVRKFLDKKIWNKLFDFQKKQEKLTVHVKAVTKGGYLVETEYGLDGFLPNSHVSFDKHTQDYTGKTLEVMIAELNPETRKLIVSQKPVLSQANFDEIAKTLKPGKKVDAIVSHITQFGIFVSIPMTVEGKETFVDGLVHISEVAWDKVTDLASLFTVSDSVEAVVTGIDTSAKRIDASIKRLTIDPFEEMLKKYQVDQKVTGIVEKITEQGVILSLGQEAGIEGFIRKEKIPPTTKYEEGQKVTVTVTNVDSKKHRVYLTPVLLAKPLMYR